MANLNKTDNNSLTENTIEVSVVMPCLNEAQTIGVCIQKALHAMKELDVSGEVVVADNGSTDGSPLIAEEAGARVVYQPVRGYGSAYLAGIGVAKGKYIIVGDSDDTYDFSNLEPFLTPLLPKFRLIITREKGNRNFTLFEMLGVIFVLCCCTAQTIYF